MSCSVASGWCQWLSQLLQYSRDIPVSSLPSGYRKKLQWKHWGEMENGKVWQVRVGVGGEQPAYPSVPHLTKRGGAGGADNTYSWNSVPAFSHGERISFPAGNSARSLISWQLRNMSLERGSPRQEKLSGNPSWGILAETPHRTSWTQFKACERQVWRSLLQT